MDFLFVMFFFCFCFLFLSVFVSLGGLFQAIICLFVPKFCRYIEMETISKDLTVASLKSIINIINILEDQKDTENLRSSFMPNTKCETKKDNKVTGTNLYCKIVNLTLMSKIKVKCHQSWYVTHHLELIYFHAKYQKHIL